MNRYNIVPLLFMVGLLIAVPVFAAETGSMDNSGRSSKSGQFHAFNASDLLGKTVKNSHGDDLGKVEDVVIGSDGRANFVVLERGGTLGIGAKYVPVPFHTFMSNSTNISKLDTDKDLIANLDISKLDGAPNFSDRKWDLSTSASQNKICSYYGAGACPYM